jgi:hypothetical protein
MPSTRFLCGRIMWCDLLPGAAAAALCCDTALQERCSVRAHLHSCTHSERRSGDGARHRQRVHGSVHEGRTRKAARHTGTRRRPPRRCCSSTRGSARERALRWCSCGPRRSVLTTSSSIDTFRLSPAPAATSTRTSGTASSPAYPDVTASGPS